MTCNISNFKRPNHITFLTYHISETTEYYYDCVHYMSFIRKPKPRDPDDEMETKEKETNVATNKTKELTELTSGSGLPASIQLEDDSSASGQITLFDLEPDISSGKGSGATDASSGDSGRSLGSNLADFSSDGSIYELSGFESPNFIKQSLESGLERFSELGSGLDSSTSSGSGYDKS